ncbi:Protein of unknown function [Desulfuromusa kysingii]|uniref:Lipopolysaccharide assembly protein A domain-containing protein n=1 Tax=Desulfuromusa kysingii TaxID=37625 RepID=A0A1H4AXV9_9BACT|nr:LapA family protein [Desulfuromusa kysingii]SEA40657.1 Protein of unknown function [Desulfuromusa kysingii]
MKLKLFTGLALLTLMLTYVVQNSARVPIIFLKWEYDVSQALLVLSSLLIGIALGLILSYTWKNKGKNQQKKAEKQARKIKKEQDKLKKQQEKLPQEQEQPTAEPPMKPQEEEQL